MELSEFKLFVEKTQRYDLEMILEVDRICKKYNIKYWLAYGTMLGAVRHQGFIPWDDDADLFMLNQDYKKFKTIIKTELDEKFRFEDIFSMPDNVMPWGKIFYKGKIAQDYPRQGLNVHHEISIDIFPLYNFPDPKTVPINSYAKKIYSLFHIIISKSNWKYRSKFKYIVSTLYGLIHLKKKISYKKKFLSAIQKYDSFNGDYLISPSLSGNVEKSIFPRSWFNTTINVDFEGCILPIPSDYDAFLKFFYGNYMMMPPEDKRWNVNHDIISYDF